MKYLTIIVLLIFNTSCAQEKAAISGETDWQKEMNTQFKDATKSPLKAKDLAVFNGLDFFKFDSAYVVKAKVKLTPDAKPFKMRTTSDRLPNYVKLCEATFTLHGAEHKLDIYRNIDRPQDGGFTELFLPFLDHTNGETSYKGGRYIEVAEPENGMVTINFNEAYNPYCAYNDKYSCPIVPIENYVKTDVKAGVKAFKKH